MTRKTPPDFRSHDDWLLHVRREIPVSEQPYALAFGRTDLLRSFYRIRRLPFPISFDEKLERIEMLHDPERTAALEALNDEMFRSLTGHLLDRARPRISEDDALRPASPREQIRELLRHLSQNNPHFELWVAYKKGMNDHSVAEDWDEYLLQELGAESAEEITFAHAMVELDKLLILFHDGNRALPSLSIERIWFLDSLRGPERMLQTRAVLGMLTAELAACTSA
jgi:hypothetical protein